MTPEAKSAYMREYHRRRKANGGNRLTHDDWAEKFDSLVQRSEGCWLWGGAKNSLGYGVMKVNGQTWYAHRLSFALHAGDLPAGCFICHHCDNPTCVKPDHLYAGDYATNGADMSSRNRCAPQAGQDNASAKLSLAQVLEIRAAYASSAGSQRQIARAFGISQAQVHNIVNRKQWKATELTAKE